MKYSYVFLLGLIVFVAYSVTGYAAGNSVTNVRAMQRTDGSNYVDIYYDLNASDPRICEACFSIDGGLTYSGALPSVTGAIGENVQPGPDRHVVWDAGDTLPDVTTESKIRMKVTFWVGYYKIPKSLSKAVAEKGEGTERDESMPQSVMWKQTNNTHNTGKLNSSGTLVEYFQKRACSIVVRQSDSPPFLLNTAEAPEAPDSSNEPVIPIYSVNTQLGHAPTLDEWGMMLFFILLVTVSVIKLRNTHP